MVEQSVHRAVYPGSFDPLTNGHVDVLGRAASLFDELIVALGVNPAKQTLFSADDRIAMLEEAVKDYDNVEVAVFEGLLVDFCAQRGAIAIVKGLRVVGDFEYELQMAQMNLRLTGVQTVLMPTSPEYSYLSSSLVKEVAAYGGDVSGLVPGGVERRLHQAFSPSQ